MILKKPYGLLIKHFKLIHFILTVLTAFLAIKTKPILDFFSDYVANNYSVTIVDNMASKYISFIIYIVILFILITLIALFILLKYKKKPNGFYLSAIVFYVFFLLAILVASYLIGSLNNGFWATASARQYRDFSNIIYWPQLVFIVMLAVRALGFNIKQFNFKDDLKDLELSEEDSELIEINLGFDLSKVERIIRRTIRETIYYFKENKFLLVFIIIIIVVILAYSVFTGYEKLHYTYKQGKSFTYNGFKINVEDSIITNIDYNGKLLSEDKYYLLTKINITNNNKENLPIDYSNFKIYIGKNVYTPTLDIGSNFIDYAIPYYENKINSSETKTYLLAYVIEKKYVNRKFNITIYTGMSRKKDVYTPKTINVKLNPVRVDGNTIVSRAKLNEEISLGGTYLGNTTFTVLDTYIGQKYDYSYNYCYRDDCREYTDFVTSDYALQNTHTLVVIGYNFNLDNTTPYYENYKNVTSFASNFFRIAYEKEGETKVVEIKQITPTNLKDKIVLQTTSEVEQADKVDLYITVRNKTYVINLVDNS